VSQVEPASLGVAEARRRVEGLRIEVPGSSANLGPGFELEYTLQRWLRSSIRGGSLSPGLLFRARRAY